jgi:hypothetical protein
MCWFFLTILFHFHYAGWVRNIIHGRNPFLQELNMSVTCHTQPAFVDKNTASTHPTEKAALGKMAFTVVPRVAFVLSVAFMVDPDISDGYVNETIESVQTEIGRES